MMPCSRHTVAIFLALLGAASLQAQPLVTGLGGDRAEPETGKASSLTNTDAVVAVVEDKIITIEDLRREIYPRIDALRRESRTEKEFYDRLHVLEEEVLNQMINRVLIVHEFLKDPRRKIPESFIDNAVAETLLAEPFNGDRAKFLAYLRTNGLTLRDYRKRVEEDVIYSYMRGQQRKSESIVSPVKVESYYRDNQSKFFQEDAVHMRLIQLTRAPGETDAQLLARAQPVVARFAAGEKFEVLARELSQDAKKAKGGDWDWQKKSALKPEFSDPLFKLSKGEISAPLLMPEAAYLLYVEDRKQAGVAPLSVVSGEIEKILVAQMAREAEETWIRRLRSTAYIRKY